MAMMKLIVFNTDKGQCAYIRTPNDYGIVLSYGECPDGPGKWLAENEVPSLKGYLTEPDAGSDVDPGVIVRRFSLDQDAVTVVTYNTPEGYTWKAVIGGDNTSEGWGDLLAQPEFASEVAGADFFVTSRKGDESGFSSELFKVMGKPLGIISCGSDESADKRYGKQAKGVKFPDGRRTHFTTGNDGNITVEMHDDGRYDVWLFRP